MRTTRIRTRARSAVTAAACAFLLAGAGVILLATTGVVLLQTAASGCRRTAESGCGANHRQVPPSTDRAEPAASRTVPATSAQATSGTAPSPVPAIEAFARTYINWNAQNVSARMGLLSRASVGQARSELAMAAAETRSDPTLQQGGIANRGVVEAVARVAGRSSEYAVVTRESTTATNTAAYQGLAPAWHLALATVRLRDGPRGPRWVISGWQPEN